MHVLLTLTLNTRSKLRFATWKYFVVEVIPTHPAHPYSPSDFPHTESRRVWRSREALWAENRKLRVLVEKVCLHTFNTMNTVTDGCFVSDCVCCAQNKAKLWTVGSFLPSHTHANMGPIWWIIHCFGQK